MRADEMQGEAIHMSDVTHRGALFPEFVLALEGLCGPATVALAGCAA